MPRGIPNNPIVRRRRARKTAQVTAPVTTPIGTAKAGSITFNTLADFMEAVKSFVSAPVITPQAAPVAASPAPVVQPRKAYQIVMNPVPPFDSTTTQHQVWSWLKAHPSAHSQQELEAGTGLTEGQIKGAIRQLRLMGYVQTLDAKNGD